MDSELNFNEKNVAEDVENEESSKKSKYISKNTGFKQKECKVIAYNKRDKTLDVLFNNYGIRIKNVNNFSGASIIEIKYKGEIGKPNFEYKL